MKINWKEGEKALTKLYPRVPADEDDESAEPGSFFNFFESDTDDTEVPFTVTADNFGANFNRIGWSCDRKRAFPRCH
jgi:template-activating factor I